MSSFNVTEYFHSIQGEGKYTGSPALFIRLAKCNLRCFFCDSKYSWSEGQEMKFSDILNLIAQYKPESVVFTGGEPLLQQDKIVKFIKDNHQILSNLIDRIEIETNGTIKPKPYFHSSFPFEICFNVSPKMKNSGNIDTIEKDVLDYFKGFNSIYKFVDTDMMAENAIVDLVSELDINPYYVYIMPEGKTAKEINERVEGIVNFCLDNRFKFCYRTHVAIWNDKRGV